MISFQSVSNGIDGSSVFEVFRQPSRSRINSITTHMHSGHSLLPSFPFKVRHADMDDYMHWLNLMILIKDIQIDFICL